MRVDSVHVLTQSRGDPGRTLERGSPEWARAVEDIEENMGEENMGEGSKRQAVLDALHGGEWWTPKEIGERAQCGKTTLHRYIRELSHERRLEGRGTTRNRMYRLRLDPPEVALAALMLAKQPPSQVVPTGLDDEDTTTGGEACAGVGAVPLLDDARLRDEPTASRATGFELLHAELRDQNGAIYVSVEARGPQAAVYAFLADAMERA